MSALVSIRQASVVDAAKVQDGGLHVVNVNRVFGDVPGVVIGCAVDRARLHSAAGEPPTVRPAEVVAAARIDGVTLAEGSAAEFAPPDNEGIVKHSALLEVAHQRGGWPFGVLALLFELCVEVAVLVPAGMHELHKSDAAFEQAAGDQAVVGK